MADRHIFILRCISTRPLPWSPPRQCISDTRSRSHSHSHSPPRACNRLLVRTVLYARASIFQAKAKTKFQKLAVRVVTGGMMAGVLYYVVFHVGHLGVAFALFAITAGIFKEVSE